MPNWPMLLNRNRAAANSQTLTPASMPGFAPAASGGESTIARRVRVRMEVNRKYRGLAPSRSIR
jgi:hypothetical protein